MMTSACSVIRKGRGTGLLLALLAVVPLVGCSSNPSPDGVGDSGTTRDATGSIDGGPTDSGNVDSGNLDSGNGGDGGDASGPTTDDPFDPLSCPDAPMTGPDILVNLAGSSRAVGNTRVVYRSRSCTGPSLASCGAWTVEESWVERIDSSGAQVMTYANALVAFYDIGGAPTLAGLHLGGPNYPGGPNTAGDYDDGECIVDATGAVSCGDYAIVFSTYGSTVMGTLQFRYASNPIHLAGKVGASCLRLSTHAGPTQDPVPGHNQWVDEEVAVLQRYVATLGKP